MLKKLIGSRTRGNILKLFVFNPGNEYFVREISRLTREPFDPARRELIRLEGIGLLKSRSSGRQKYYSINVAHPLFPEFKSIILKTEGVGEAVRGRLAKRDDISAAFIYGSYAKNTEDMESDIDLFVVGDISSADMAEIVSAVEPGIKREVNFALYTAVELKKKFKAKNSFLTEVYKGPKIFLKGNDDVFRKLVRTGKTA